MCWLGSRVLRKETTKNCGNKTSWKMSKTKKEELEGAYNRGQYGIIY
jgi:hypothetical protein